MSLRSSADKNDGLLLQSLLWARREKRADQRVVEFRSLVPCCDRSRWWCVTATGDGGDGSSAAKTDSDDDDAATAAAGTDTGSRGRRAMAARSLRRWHRLTTCKSSRNSADVSVRRVGPSMSFASKTGAYCEQSRAFNQLSTSSEVDTTT